MIIYSILDAANQVVDTHQVLVAESIQVNSVAPPFAQKFIQLLGWGKWIVYFLGICGLIGAGGVYAVERFSERGDNKASKIVLSVCVGAIIVGAATGIMDAIAS